MSNVIELFTVISQAIVPVLVALLSAGGFWSYREKQKEEKTKNRDEQITKVCQEISNISAQVEKIDKTITDLQEGQNVCAVKLDRLKDIENKFGNFETLIDELKDGSALSIAFARDRLNYLANKYIKQGYIPKEDIIPFKMLGETYIACKQNSEVKLKFQHCIDNLPVIDADKSEYDD